MFGLGAAILELLMGGSSPRAAMAQALGLDPTNCIQIIYKFEKKYLNLYRTIAGRKTLAD